MSMVSTPRTSPPLTSFNNDPFVPITCDDSDSKTWTVGDLVYLNAAGKPVIIINSVKAAVDLLDRRAANTSNRPKNIVASDLLTGGMFMTLQNLTDECEFSTIRFRF